MKPGTLMAIFGIFMAGQSVFYLMRGRSQPRSIVLTGPRNAIFCWFGIIVGLLVAAVGLEIIPLHTIIINK